MLKVNEHPSILPIEAPGKIPEGNGSEEDGTTGGAEFVESAVFADSVVLTVAVEVGIIEEHMLCCWLVRLKTSDIFCWWETDADL